MTDQTQTCLTIDELTNWAGSRSLAPERAGHLDVCERCKSLAEQMESFDPEAAADLALARLAPAPSRLVTVVGASILGLLLAAAVWLVWDGNATDRRRLAYAADHIATLETELAIANSRVAALAEKVQQMSSPPRGDAASVAVAAKPSRTTGTSLGVVGDVSATDLAEICKEYWLKYAGLAAKTTFFDAALKK